MALFGESSTVKAQRMANEANLQMNAENNAWNYQIATETNQLNQYLAEAANRLNWDMFTAQNDWNLQQWERENAYNDPSAQLERYMKAGINPLWAIGNGNPGNAQSITSGGFAPPEVAHMVAPQMKAGHVDPEYDPTRLNNIVAASRDVVNAGLGFYRLGIEGFDADTRRMSQRSQENLNLASAAQKRAATTGQEIENRWNLDTFDVRSQSEQQKLVNLKKQLSLMDDQSEMYKSLKANYDASTDLAKEKYNRIAEDYRLAWASVDNQRKIASAAQTNANAAQQNASTNEARAKAEVAKWSNDSLVSWLDKFGPDVAGKASIHAEGKVGASIGIPGTNSSWSVSGGVKGEMSYSTHMPASLDILREAGYRAIQWASEEPDNPQAVHAAQQAVDCLQKVDNNIHVPFDPRPGDSSNPVINPEPLKSFGSWSSWQ